MPSCVPRLTPEGPEYLRLCVGVVAVAGGGSGRADSVAGVDLPHDGALGSGGAPGIGDAGRHGIVMRNAAPPRSHFVIEIFLGGSSAVLGRGVLGGGQDKRVVVVMAFHVGVGATCVEVAQSSLSLVHGPMAFCRDGS